MIASTTRDFAADHAAAYHSLPWDQRPTYLLGELAALLVDINRTIEDGDAHRFLHHAAMLSRAYDVPCAALQRAVGGCDGD